MAFLWTYWNNTPPPIHLVGENHREKTMIFNNKKRKNADLHVIELNPLNNLNPHRKVLTTIFPHGQIPTLSRIKTGILLPIPINHPPQTIYHRASHHAKFRAEP